jgi:uroporphyrinogen decarboxylase
MRLPIEKPAPDIDRFVKVVKGEIIPGKPPLTELLIDREIIKQIGENFLGLTWTEYGPERENKKKFWDFMVRVHMALGYDYLWVWGTLKFQAKVRKAIDTAEISRGTREWVETSVGIIKNWDDYESYPWPIFDDECLWDYEYVSSILPDGMGMFVGNGDGFCEVVSEILLGYENMCYLMYDDPELVDAVIERSGNIIVDANRKMLEVPKVAGIFIGDDLGFVSSTFFSADYLRANILPWHRKLSDLAHRKGLLYMLHSCGKLDEIMDDLIDDIKIDAKHSFEDKCSPVIPFKQKYGERIAVLGGVDLDKLCRLEEKDLRSYIRNILETCMPGGKYAFGSGNSIANYIPIPNYLIMLEEGYRFG